MVGGSKIPASRRYPIVRLTRLKLPSSTIRLRGSQLQALKKDFDIVYYSETEEDLEESHRKRDADTNSPRRYNSVKRLVCGRCNQRFFLKYTLKLHLSKCLGKKQFTKSVCSRPRPKQLMKNAQNIASTVVRCNDTAENSNDDTGPPNLEPHNKPEVDDYEEPPTLETMTKGGYSKEKSYQIHKGSTENEKIHSKTHPSNIPNRWSQVKNRPALTARKSQVLKSLTKLARKQDHTSDGGKSTEAKQAHATVMNPNKPVPNSPMKGRPAKPGHVCVYCRKSLNSMAHLKEHIRTHTGEKPYTCCYCNKRFAQKGNMQTHIRKLHLKDEHTPQSPTSVVPQSPSSASTQSQMSQIPISQNCVNPQSQMGQIPLSPHNVNPQNQMGQIPLSQQTVNPQSQMVQIPLIPQSQQSATPAYQHCETFQNPQFMQGQYMQNPEFL